MSSSSASSPSDNQARAAFLKTCLVKDLRVECRRRGINPAGSRDTLVEKLSTAMSASNETSFKQQPVAPSGPPSATDAGVTRSVNNYTRPEGQNVGNFLTDRSSSRVSAPPGGKSSVHFFGATAPSQVVEDSTRRSMSPPANKEARPVVPVAEKIEAPMVEAPEKKEAPPPPVPPTDAKEEWSLAQNDYAPDPDPVGERRSSNNYTRPGGRQNVGNYMTGRNTSRVLAPPGGGSSISFG